MMGSAAEPSRTERNRNILALRGTMSFSLIGEALGLTRDVVAGVVWRADYPVEVRRRHSACGKKIGTGHSGPGRYPRRTKFSRPRVTE